MNSHPLTAHYEQALLNKEPSSQELVASFCEQQLETVGIKLAVEEAALGVEVCGRIPLQCSL